MPKKGHSEEQIVAALRQGEAGEKVSDICRKMGISEATFYTWRKHYAGLGLDELRELRQLREENGRLKRLVADLSLDRQILQGDCHKKAVKPRARRKLVSWAKEAYRLSERRATRLMKLDRSSHRYRSRRDPQEAFRRRMREIAATHVRYGYRRLAVLLRREGWKVNTKRVYRIYAEEGLTVRTKQRKKIARRQRVPAPLPTRASQCWSMDFVNDKLADGRGFRILTVVDQFTRECICLRADRAMTSVKVVEALMAAIAEYGGAPESITVDNGSEFTGRALEAWVMAEGVQLNFIRPGRPVENSYIESFNGRLRDEFLNVEWFSSLDDARRKLATWRVDYNHHRHG